MTDQQLDKATKLISEITKCRLASADLTVLISDKEYNRIIVGDFGFDSHIPTEITRAFLISLRDHYAEVREILEKEFEQL